MQVRRLLLLCPLAFALAPPAARASFDLTSQTRDVGVTVTQHTLSCLPPPTGCSVLSTTNFFDSESAPDFSPFSATASVSPSTTIFSTQASTLAATSLVAQGNGTHAGSGALTTPPNIYTTSESTSTTLHRVGFDVDAATPYRLSGSVTSTGGLSANATTRITLKTSGGAKLAEVVAATDSNCQDPSCAVVGPLPVASYGVLAPGSYVLEVEAERRRVAVLLRRELPCADVELGLQRPSRRGPATGTLPRWPRAARGGVSARRVAESCALAPRARLERLVSDDPHREELRAAAVRVAERALARPSTWCSPARPRTCSAASAKRSIPDAPIGFDESTPPDGLIGMSPSSAVAPSWVIFQPSPSGAKPRFSIHIGSNQLKGT